MDKIKIDSTLQNKAKQKKSIFHSSSSVFLCILNPDFGIDTEISLLNHFILKRDIRDVEATFEIRDLSGDIVKSFRISMDKECAYAVKLSDYLKISFIGSVYVFFKSSKNLAVPFCAVMSVIKATNSVCGVHTYGRRLEEEELKTGIDLQRTIETGWTARDSRNVKSFAALHGGRFELQLKIKIECSNYLGKVININTLKNLLPFATLLIIPQDLHPEIVEHLDGNKGHFKIYIDGLNGVFPRMICGNFASNSSSLELKNAQEVQFTHTNFDFSTIEQPDSIGKLGYFNQPSLPSGYGLIYPVNTDKKIKIDNKNYSSGSIHQIYIDPISQAKVFSEKDNLPSRFIGAAVGIWNNSELESECSTGTFIEDYLKIPCHWHWGLLKTGLENGESEITIILNKFKKNSDLSRTLKLSIFNSKQLINEMKFELSGHKKINSIDILPSEPKDSLLWYVLSGNNLEDLNIFSTFYPQNKSGFTEHAF